MNGTKTQPILVQCSVPQGSEPVKFISYTEDVGSVFNQDGVRHHLYADDKQAYVDVPPRDSATARSVLMNCIHDISSWCSSRRLQLDSEKTELIWFGSRHTLQNVNYEDPTLQLGSTVIEPARVLCDLGLLLDDEHAMKQHITKVAPMHLLLSATAAAPAEMLILGRELTAQSQRLSCHASTIVYYCLSRPASHQADPLQRVQNAAARLVLSLNLRDH